jgi:streptogramin lyase
LGVIILLEKIVSIRAGSGFGLSHWAALGCALMLGSAEAMAQQITEFPIAQLSNANSGGSPIAIVTGSDGNLWFTQQNGYVGQLGTNGNVTIFSGGFGGGSSFIATGSIVNGPDGNIWFTENASNMIATITPNGAGSEFPVSNGAGPAGLAVGADGNLWFAENSSDSIGRMSTGGTLTEFTAGISRGAQPVGIAAGPDGNLWFTEFLGNRIGRMGLDGTVTEFSAGLVTGQLPYAITAGPDGNLWFTDVGMNQIGRITTSGVITMFSAGISANALPGGIVAGPDGNLWFTEQTTGRIGRITPAGVVTEFSAGISANAQPLGITAGPDGNLWFTEYGTSSIARITTGPTGPQAGYWWNPAAFGRGYVIEQRGGNLFLGAFLYDANGNATWYGVGPGAMTGATYSGVLTTYANGQTLNGAYQAPIVSGTAGSFTIKFTSATQASVTWPNGAVDQIERYEFGPVNANGSNAVTPQTGWWWAPSESGRGFAIEVQGGMMFFTGYMYDANGNPVWYTSQPAVMARSNFFSGEWEEFGGGQTLESPYRSPTVVNAMVGAVSIQFTSSTTGVFTLPDGRQIAIERFVF